MRGSVTRTTRASVRSRCGEAAARWERTRDFRFPILDFWFSAEAGAGGALLLAQASTPAQRALVGGQGGGRVWLFLHTDDFAAEHARLSACGVRFEESPRDEPYGRVAVFVDCWGNRWDLVQPSGAAP